jgi:PHD/YefM family antitoxin component YafN of YafNO toxin-antitoxin module
MSLSDHIIPMSELRADPDKIKKLLKTSPVIITNKGRPDFGICDLDTLETAIAIQKLKILLAERSAKTADSMSLDEAFSALDQKYGL